ncbi:hypothetical protein [Brevundimonas sp. NIBR11]|uniref:hypothetical protein n=1 Tax=Brevundimonas sp. NIBR11 TaxID=3015999 RepID=UPI0022F00491|nr:hypothetical protein [Brevundimonas sp. NIBR11]WGM32755.1 hypothetical protein KKHFBJBL_03009 [Brevundimonas sp. NIBR11]
MSGFEYIFTFYGLLLGLAVANATNNVAEMWRSSPEVKVGLPPPLLCLFILLSAAQGWTSFWAVHDSLTMEPVTLMMCIGMAAPYIFVSHGMTPAREGSASFEDYYITHRKTLMAVLVIPPLLSMAYNLARSGFEPLGETAYWIGVLVLPRVVIPAALAFIRSPGLHALGLTILCAHTIWRIFL